MKISIIIAHPHASSFNHAIAKTCVKTLLENGHEIVTHDLYTEEFNPILPYEEFSRDAVLPADIQQHCDEISQADGIIIIHPNWWGQPPAILKGWVDRVIRPGVAYEFLEGDKGEGVPQGLLKAKFALIFNTSNTETSRELTIFGDPLETTWRNCIFGLCGVPVFHRRMFNIVITSTDEQRKVWLSEVESTVMRFFPGRGASIK
jgi:putative NADPH-quinone reductase